MVFHSYLKGEIFMKKSLVLLALMFTFAAPYSQAKCYIHAGGGDKASLLNINDWVLQAVVGEIKASVSLSADKLSVDQMRIDDLSMGVVIISSITKELSSVPALYYQKNGQTFNLICGN